MKINLSEADIQRQITDYLALDGWRALRTDPTSDRARGKGFGELGMPDMLYIRYGNGTADVLWIEHKKPGGKVHQHQADWAMIERARGGVVLIATRDFHPCLDGFREWYKKSGLRRRVDP